MKCNVGVLPLQDIAHLCVLIFYDVHINEMNTRTYEVGGESSGVTSLATILRDKRRTPRHAITPLGWLFLGFRISAQWLFS
jgi:hypothetical protein